MTRDRVNLGAAAVLDPNAGKPFRAVSNNRRNGREGLGVVYRGGFTKGAYLGRKWRLETRLSFFALQRLQQCRLLTADICPRAALTVQLLSEF